MKYTKNITSLVELDTTKLYKMSELDILYPGKAVLHCINIGSKLKIKIASSGYIRGANCQFPSNIRVPGYYYLIDRKYLQLSHRSSGKAFYTAMSGKNYITIIDNPLIIAELDRICTHSSPSPLPPSHIYEDIDNPNCIICMSEPKTTVYVPCGHYVCCNECTKRIVAMKNKCPMCQTKLLATIPRDMVE
jgi:hypothetical protein